MFVVQILKILNNLNIKITKNPKIKIKFRKKFKLLKAISIN